MKYYLPLAVALASLLPAASTGQTIETGAVNMDYCKDDTLHVPFITTGSFDQNNAFILQLSRPNGDFSTGFINLASVSQSSSGTISVKIDHKWKLDKEYQVRVISSNPVVMGTPSGSLTVHSPIDNPVIEVPPMSEEDRHKYGDNYRYTLDTDTISFSASWVEEDKPVLWEFGEGAIPATSDQVVPPPVRYTSTGIKNVRLTVGAENECQGVGSMRFYVFPTVVSIPPDAIVITPGMDYQPMYPYENLWICPGATFTPKDDLMPTVFVEPGGHVNAYEATIYKAYIKPGASMNGSAVHTFFTDSSGISGDLYLGSQLFPCPQIAFDYTDAPEGGCPSLAPYSISISAQTEMVSGKHTNNDDDSEFLVNEQGELHAGGAFNRYLIASGGRVTAHGNHNTVYVKKGASFEAENSGHHYIFYEEGANILAAGDNSLLVPVSSITFVSQPVSIAEHTTLPSDDFHIYPNPVSDELAIYRKNLSERAEMTLHNLLGEVIVRDVIEPGESMTKSDVTEFPKGSYFLRVQSRNALQYIRVLVQ